MKKSIINIPIYDYRLHVIVTSDIEEVNKKYNLNYSNFKGLCLRHTKRRLLSIIFNNKKGINFGTIAHEIVHVKNYIFYECGYNNDVSNDEAEAYFVGWLTNKVVTTLKKMGEFDKCI